jgi:hypothetical protein
VLVFGGQRKGTANVQAYQLYRSAEDCHAARAPRRERACLGGLQKHGISAVNFYKWQKILFEEGASLFERKPNASNVRRQEAAAVKQVQELEATVTRKNEVIAERLKQHYANGRSATEKSMSTTHGYPEITG